MTEVTVRLYTLSELQEVSDVGYTQAMGRALEGALDSFASWGGAEVVANWATVVARYGIEIDPQGVGWDEHFRPTFDGRFACRINGAEVLAWVLAEAADPGCAIDEDDVRAAFMEYVSPTDLRTWRHLLQVWESEGDFTAERVWSIPRGGYHIAHEWGSAGGRWPEYPLINEAAQEFGGWLIDLAERLTDALQDAIRAEYEWVTSERWIHEEADANGRLYDENGREY